MSHLQKKISSSWESCGPFHLDAQIYMNTLIGLCSGLISSILSLGGGLFEVGQQQCFMQCQVMKMYHITLVKNHVLSLNV